MFGSNSKVWVVGLFVALGLLSWALFRNFEAPWIDGVGIDFNGACWSQSAHNTMRAGLLATRGVPSAFYFGPLPIPPSGYYTHHPPLLSLMLAGMFAVLGEKEWVARLLPITFSLVGVVLLWAIIKDCAGSRAATFGALLFAVMPMELVYGRMVNFEPVNLVWMLGGLFCLRRWEQTGERGWRNWMLAAFVLSLWTAWLGYMFVLILSVHFFTTRHKRDPRLALLLLGLCVASIVLFMLQIHWVQPNAWQDCVAAVRRWISRKGWHGSNVTWNDWGWWISRTLVIRIHPMAWALAVIGGVWLLRYQRKDEPLRWLGWVALCFVVLSAFYVVVFRRASYIHPYAQFYFIVPVAIAGGIAVEALARWCESQSSCARAAGFVAIVGVYAWLVFSGERQGLVLYRHFRILDPNKPEPASLILELSRVINERFPEDTTVICNFFVDYQPQLEYYAQRTILSSKSPAEWTDATSEAELFSKLRWRKLHRRRNLKADERTNVTEGAKNTQVGGVIWLGEPGAKKILAALPAGLREQINVQGIPFCFWTPVVSPKLVALTFDDGPYGEATNQILDILKEERVHATFFLLGINVEKYPAITKRIVNEGHVIGNHSYAHSHLLGYMPTADFQADVRHAENSIVSATGLHPHYYRPPWGWHTPSMDEQLKDMGYVVILWDLGAKDYDQGTSPETIVEEVINNTLSGKKREQVILLHDGRDVQIAYPRQNVIQALPRIIDQLKARGYEFVTVEQITHQSPYR